MLARPTPGIPFELRIGYGSANSAGKFLPGETDPSLAGPLENRWHHSLETRVIPMKYFGDTTTLGLLMWNGSIETWDRVGNTTNYLTRRKEYCGEFFDVGTDTHVWVTPERLVYTFRARGASDLATQGKLLSITDSNSNQLLLQYDNNGVLTKAVDSGGGQWAFNPRGDSLLQSVTFGAWSVQFAYDGNNRLISKTLTNSSGLYTTVPATWRFNYYTTGAASNFLQSIVDPRGNTEPGGRLRQLWPPHQHHRRLGPVHPHGLRRARHAPDHHH